MRLTPLRRHRGLEVPGVLGKQDHVRRRRGRPGNAFKPCKPPLRIARLCTGPMNQGVLRRMLPPHEVPPFPTAIRLHDRRILRITPTISRLILTNQGPRVQQQQDRAGGVRPFHDFILQDKGAWLLFAGRLPGHLLRAPPFPTVLMQSPTHRFHAIRHLERGRHLGFDGLCLRGGPLFHPRHKLLTRCRLQRRRLRRIIERMQAVKPLGELRRAPIHPRGDASTEEECDLRQGGVLGEQDASEKPNFQPSITVMVAILSSWLHFFLTKGRWCQIHIVTS